MLSFCNNIIAFSFYALFFFVPLIFLGNTSELFELPKMLLTFGLAIIIGATWATKMIIEKKLFIQRTPLDIPILLFLSSQIISTLFSLDNYVSWWGYYSRWNGGLLSMITYVFLYYAFVSNLGIKHVFRSLTVSLFSGLAVALWGFPAHFGYDPTCFVFRGTLDTTCWTEQFKPTVRIFSTLGQPAWMAAYLTVLLPLTIAYALNNTKSAFRFWSLVALTTLLFLCLIYANTRAAFIAFAVSNLLVWGIILLKKIFTIKDYLRYFVLFNIIFLFCSFLPGSPIKDFFESFVQKIASQAVPQAMAQEPTTPEAPNQSQNKNPEVLITDSGQIRLNVWKGAIDTWKANPIFGTGVETYAYAYYKYKPAEHNLTSEWDYLYNKAHNEYLTYLATTGIYGLGTHLFMLGFFLFLAIKQIIHLQKSEKSHLLLLIAFIAGYISIIITNFFNFSVVIMNIFLFLFPAFTFILTNTLPNKAWQLPSRHTHHEDRKYGQAGTSPFQWTGITIIFIMALLWLGGLINYLSADVDYALGNNLDKVGQYVQGNEPLMNAVKKRPDEPVYQDELSQNLAVLANALSLQKETQKAEQLASEAVRTNNDVVEKHPNNVIYWKNRVRLFYTLMQSDLSGKQSYLIEAVNAIDKARELAPNDAKIAYNQGVLHGQVGEFDKAIALLEETIKLKPNYRDAYFALGLYYRQLAVDKDDKVVNEHMQQKAVEIMQALQNNLGGDDKQIKETLKSWGAVTK